MAARSRTDIATGAAIGLLLFVFAWLAAAAPAEAIVVQRYAIEEVRFAGAGCGATDTHTVAIPRGGYNVRIEEPDVLLGLRGRSTSEYVAEISGRRVRGSRSAGFFVDFTARGSDISCEAGAPPAWETELVELWTSFSRRESVYFLGAAKVARVKPRVAQLGRGRQIRGLRWTSWGGRVARGRGKLNGARVDVRLSGYDLCEKVDRWTYMKLSHARPGARAKTVRFSRNCVG